jgi:hypothetical protein
MMREARRRSNRSAEPPEIKTQKVPDRHPWPGCERIGRRVLAELPALFRRHVGDVVIKVENFPDEKTEREMALESPFDLLGLYRGVPVVQGFELGPPRQDVDMIFLYRRPLLITGARPASRSTPSCATPDPRDPAITSAIPTTTSSRSSSASSGLDRLALIVLQNPVISRVSHISMHARMAAAAGSNSIAATSI